MPVDWEGIRLFAAIADAGSLTQAAARTGISQPTLSRKLKDLEDSLGGALFERLPNQLVLTIMGGQLIDTARSMTAAADSLQQKALSLARSGHSPIRISATSSISTLLVQNILELAETAMKNGSEIQIESSRMPSNLAFREADIAIRLRRYPPEGHLRVRRLGSIAFCMYGSVDASIDAVVGLIQDRPPPKPGWVDDYAARKGLPIAARLGEYFLRQEAAAQGLGATLLPCFIADKDPRLKRLGDPAPELEEEAFILVRDGPGEQAGLRAVADCICDIFRRKSAELAGDLSKQSTHQQMGTPARK